MKNYLFILFFALLGLVSCKNEDEVLDLQTVLIQLEYPQEIGVEPQSGVKVKMVSPTSTYEATTNDKGEASFTIPSGIYELSATDSRTVNYNVYLLNGLKTGVTVSNSGSTTPITVTLPLSESKSSQVIIKEVFVGGTPKDDGSGSFAYDKYIILYNNSSVDVDLKDVCLGISAPYNAQATNNYYGEDGQLLYEKENWIPATQGYWYFTNSTILKAGQQIVVALNNAVNNTLTYSKSINFDNPNYYVTYDIETFPNPSIHVSPASSIPTTHYLKGQRYSAGNAWTISNTSPAVFLFRVEGTTPAAFASDAATTHTLTSVLISKKVPVSWVLDGVETFLMNNANNKKRFTKNIDAGYVYHESRQGYSVYRNVDQEATEAIAENAGKLVYNYNLGTTNLGNGGSTDASGIDAEASIKNGARIIYKDTNNSSNDFHLRSKASLRTN